MSNLEMNEPVKKDEAKATYNPSPQDQARIKLINQRLEESKEWRKQYDQNWLEDYHMFRGKQWKNERPSYRHSEVVNLIWQGIQQQVPILTDSRPKFQYTPEDPTDREFADILNEVADFDWSKNNWDYKLLENLYDQHIYGTFLGYMGYDPDARYGAGGICYESKELFYCFPAPSARDVKAHEKDSRCPWFIEAEPVDVGMLKKQYPEFKDFIKADLIDLIHGSKTELEQAMYKTPSDTPTVLDMHSGYDTINKNKALKITMYEMSDEEVEEQEVSEEIVETQDPVTGEIIQQVQQKVEYVQKLKYPNGRKSVIAGGVLVYDDANPYDDGDYPYVKGINYVDPRSFFGISEIEPVKRTQKLFNKIISYMVDVFVMTGNPIWIVDHNSDVDPENLINRPGLVVEKAPGSQVRREGGVGINPDLFQLLDRVRNYFNDTMGTSEAQRGVRPEGITAAAAIQALQDAAGQRLRLKSRILDGVLQRMGELYKNRVFQFYDTPRIIRVTNKPGVEKYFKFHVQKTEDGGKVGVVQEFNVDPVTGKYSEALETKEFIIRGDFDVKVNTGSSLAFVKDANFNKALQLFDRGALDMEELLKSSDYPNWEQVLERIKAREAQAAEAQMMAQQMPPAQEGAPPAPAPALQG